MRVLRAVLRGPKLAKGPCGLTVPAVTRDALHLRGRGCRGAKSLNDRFGSKYGEAYREAMTLLTVRAPI